MNIDFLLVEPDIVAQMPAAQSLLAGALLEDVVEDLHSTSDCSIEGGIGLSEHLLRARTWMKGGELDELAQLFVQYLDFCRTFTLKIIQF